MLRAVHSWTGYNGMLNVFNGFRQKKSRNIDMLQSI